MEHKTVRGVVAAFLIAASAVAVYLTAPRPREQSPAKAELTAPPEPKAPKRPPMEFTRQGVAGEIAKAVERVVRRGRAKVAIARRNGGRWVCILVDQKSRTYELDRGMDPADFPFLETGGFQRPPSHIARTGTSIYRAKAKRAMDYDRQRGDRILILLCPREQWPELDFSWPPPEDEGQVHSDEEQAE